MLREASSSHLNALARSAYLGRCFLKDERGKSEYLDRLLSDSDQWAVNLGFRVAYSGEAEQVKDTASRHDCRPLLASTSSHNPPPTRLLPDYVSLADTCGEKTLLYVVKSLQSEPDIMEVNLATITAWLERSSDPAAIARCPELIKPIRTQLYELDRESDRWDSKRRALVSILQRRLDDIQ